MENKNYERAERLLAKSWENDIYKPKDRTLYYLELGAVQHFSGDFSESFNNFKKAEQAIDELYTKSITRGIRSFVVNDYALAYEGEDYEDIYLNIFNSLNFLHLNDLESALVEARRVAYKLEQLDIRYRGLVEALSKADSTGFDHWETGKSNIQNSALGHFLAGVLYSKTGSPDDARIEAEKVKIALDNQRSVYQFRRFPPDKLIDRIKKPESFNVVLISFSGKAPVKTQFDTRLYLDDYNIYLKLALPRLQLRPTSVHSVRAVVEERDAAPLYLIEEMDKVAAEVYKVKMPLIYARTVVRATLKSLGTKKVVNDAKKQGKALKRTLGVFGAVGQESTEKADLRSWQTMPGRAYVTLLDLPKGTHTITMEYHGPYRLLYMDKKTVEIKPGENKIHLVESVYWN